MSAYSPGQIVRYRLQGTLFRVKLTRDDGDTMAGVEVDTDGLPREMGTIEAPARHVLIVARADITNLTPLRENRKYGGLEEDR